MQFYNYRSVKAMSDHRHPKVAKGRVNPGPPGSAIPHDEVWKVQIPMWRKKRSNNRAPNRSRAA